MRLKIKLLLDPEVMALYFKYYFYERADQMAYPLNEKQVGRTDTLLNLLSDNKLNTGVRCATTLKTIVYDRGQCL